MDKTMDEQVSAATLKKVICAAGVGNFVEWFDFAVYGFLATAIAQQFFPSSDATTGLLKTFAVFAVALLSGHWAVSFSACLATGSGASEYWP